MPGRRPIASVKALRNFFSPRARGQGGCMLAIRMSRRQPMHVGALCAKRCWRMRKWRRQQVMLKHQCTKAMKLTAACAGSLPRAAAVTQLSQHCKGSTVPAEGPSYPKGRSIARRRQEIGDRHLVRIRMRVTLPGHSDVDIFSPSGRGYFRTQRTCEWVSPGKEAGKLMSEKRRKSCSPSSAA